MGEAVTDLEQFAQRIAAAVGLQELAFCRKIGMGELEAAKQSFRVLDETYNAVFAPERAAPLTRFRPMGTK